MKKTCLIFCLVIITVISCKTAKLQKEPLETVLPVRGFCIAAPTPRNLDSFLTFVNKELAPRKVNTLVLRVDFNYRYESQTIRDTVPVFHDRSRSHERLPFTRPGARWPLAHACSTAIQNGAGAAGRVAGPHRVPA